MIIIVIIQKIKAQYKNVFFTFERNETGDWDVSVSHDEKRSALLLIKRLLSSS